jgi:hypothetical protein
LVGCAHSSVSDWENEVTRNVGADNPSNPRVKRPRGRKTKLSRVDRGSFPVGLGAAAISLDGM